MLKKTIYSLVLSFVSLKASPTVQKNHQNNLSSTSYLNLFQSILFGKFLICYAVYWPTKYTV